MLDLSRIRRATSVALVVGSLVGTLAGCGGLLDVSDPTLVRDSDIANASGADGRRLAVLTYLSQQLAPVYEDVAKITDEWTIDEPPDSYDYLDKRDSEGYETAIGLRDAHLGALDYFYYQTSFAIPSIRAYTPDSLKNDFLAQLFAIRGFAVLQAAEDLCPGFPLNDVTPDLQPVFSGPLTTDSALTLANTQLDSAVAHAGDTARFVVLARVTKGRALLDQGKYSEAAAMVASVPTDGIYQVGVSSNKLYSDVRPGRWIVGGFNIAVGDGEGGNGQPFVSANDSRVPIVRGGPRAGFPAETLYKSNVYPTSTTPITLATGTEARLIEAEVALHDNDPNWLTILNDLRATAIDPALPPLTDPGTTATRVDLVYHERAFWLYTTGRRLGDLRRLIRNYGRSAESVFPTGAYALGGTYGPATAIPFSLAAQRQSNPHITTGCTTR